MSDPPRLLDDDQAPRELVAGLRALPRPSPASPETKAQLTAHWASLAGISSGAGGATVVAPWIKIALVSGLVLAGGGLFVGLRHASSDAGRSTSNLVGEPSASPNDAPSMILPVAATPVAESAEPERARPLTTKPAGADRVAPPVPEARDTLAQEEALLERARQTITDAPAESLKRLAEHQRRFPSGKLTPERMYLSAAAHSRLGQTAQARKQADLLHQQYPSSVYAKQVDALVAARSAPPD